MSHHLTSLRSVAAMLVVSGLAAVTSAAGSFEVEARETTLASTSLLLQPPAPQQTAPSGSTPASTAVAGSAAMYASKGWTGWTVTLGAANDFDSNTDLTVQGFRHCDAGRLHVDVFGGSKVSGDRHCFLCQLKRACSAYKVCQGWP